MFGLWSLFGVAMPQDDSKDHTPAWGVSATLPPPSRVLLSIADQTYITECMNKAAAFQRFDQKRKKLVSVDCPSRIASHWLARKGGWGLPIIQGVASTPFMRRDGSLCETVGYDSKSKLLYQPNEEFPAILQNPGKEDAVAALRLIARHVRKFPFVKDEDESVFLSAVLTALDRRQLLNAPLHAFTAPVAGTGITLLMEVISIIATGKTVPVVAQVAKVEEFEKQLGAMLIAGVSMVGIDNCTHPLDSGMLNAMLTADVMRVRVLGESRFVDTPVNTMVCATGNDLTVVGDLTRRTIIASLDAECERPELREFEGSLKEDTKRLRTKLVTAGLTVLRAWHIHSASHQVGVAPLGSFEDWCARIRDALIWLGKEDPCETMTRLRKEDPKRQKLVFFIEQWKRNFRYSDEFSARQLIDRVEDRTNAKTVTRFQDFRDILASIAMNARGELSPEKLGHWLKAHVGKPVGDAMIGEPRFIAGRQVWSLQKVQTTT
jgi:putative DNA primase/helicase